MNKKAKKIIIGSLIGAVTLYFGLGIVGTLIATEGFINVRNCLIHIILQPPSRLAPAFLFQNPEC